MTFYLSRFVREDVSLKQFIEGLHDFLKQSMCDPQNNIGELDKSLSAMLERKIFCAENARSGLMFNNPAGAAVILTNPFLLELLFYPRVFIRKHEWRLHYLSPISRNLCKENLFSKLPSIYKKYGREIDLNRNIIHVSTVDYFFMSFISYPMIVGREIPRILNALYSSHKYCHELDSSSGWNWNSLWGKSKSKSEYLNKNSFPTNPFGEINVYYAQIFGYYLNVFLNSKSSGSGSSVLRHDFGIKLIEIIGELWFAQSFAERPIGDRCFTLRLMQDLVFVVIGKQIEYQYLYISDSNCGNNFKSCICPELRCLLRYLYAFLCESFTHFPLDFIANLRIIIEIFVYVLAPWSVEYKLQNPDSNLQVLKERERFKFEESRRKHQETFLSKIIKKYIVQNETQNTDSNSKYNNMFVHNENDDRLRSLNINNTEFETAAKLINYELSGIESCNIKIWRQYIVELLPFYSCLISDLMDTLLKYDFAHPLKQLPVLKVLHVYNNADIVRTISSTEQILFNPANNVNNGDARHVLNIIQQITMKSINFYKCLPFNSNNNSNCNKTKSKAHHLYIKCRKVMLRLCPPHPHPPQNKKSMPYFIDPQDNVQIIRYIIGELESLFQIGPQQQENLMNVSIMYEPSRSPSNNNNNENDNDDYNNQNQNDDAIINIWNQPKGEWESFYALKFAQIFYHSCIQNTSFDDFYLQYFAKYHRKYCIDSRVLTWVTLFSAALAIYFLYSLLWPLSIVALLFLGLALLPRFLL